LNELPIELIYDDFKFEDIMKAILPEDLLKDNVNVKGYSVIGHIAHFNLRENVLDYKKLIGNNKIETFINFKI
jgi:tRNA (guanine37-N1)-methyltransferase